MRESTTVCEGSHKQCGGFSRVIAVTATHSLSLSARRPQRNHVQQLSNHNSSQSSRRVTFRSTCSTVRTSRLSPARKLRSAAMAATIMQIRSSCPKARMSDGTTKTTTRTGQEILESEHMDERARTNANERE